MPLLSRARRFLTDRPQRAATFLTFRSFDFVMVTHDSAIARRAPRAATIRKGRITVRENTRT